MCSDQRNTDKLQHRSININFTKMDKFWICVFTVLVLFKDVTNGQTEVKVQLVVKKYIEKGSSVALQCNHNVKPEILYKVVWFKSGESKFFEYINGRDPPFRNLSIAGAEIDVSNSNEHQVTLKNIDFEAAGYYYCEVSTATPIFTKASHDEQLHVILPQTGPPKITFSRRQFYVGEKLVANCTTTKSRPPPHITWLIDGKKVEDKYTRILHPILVSSGKNSHRSKTHQQNNPSYDKMDVMESYAKNSNKDETPFSPHNSNPMGHENHQHHGGGYNHENLYYTEMNKQKQQDNENHEIFDNKHYDTRKHRNSRKYRRFVGDGTVSIVKNLHRPSLSASQLSIEVARLQPSATTGRVEITCLATIPAHVDIGEEFADYKTFSVKIEIDTIETTSLVPSSIVGASSSLESNYAFTIHNIRLNKYLILIISLPLFITVRNIFHVK